MTTRGKLPGPGTHPRMSHSEAGLSCAKALSSEGLLCPLVSYPILYTVNSGSLTDCHFPSRLGVCVTFVKRLVRNSAVIQPGPGQLMDPAGWPQPSPGQRTKDGYRRHSR